jgi:hypothetical protein
MTDWLPHNPEINDLMVSCTHARLTGALSGVVVELLQVEAKAKARCFLQSIAKGADATGG